MMIEERNTKMEANLSRLTPGLERIFEFQTAGMKTAVEILPKGVVDQGLCGKTILSRQMLTGE